VGDERRRLLIVSRSRKPGISAPLPSRMLMVNWASLRRRCQLTCAKSGSPASGSFSSGVAIPGRVQSRVITREEPACLAARRTRSAGSRPPSGATWSTSAGPAPHPPPRSRGPPSCYWSAAAIATPTRPGRSAAGAGTRSPTWSPGSTGRGPRPLRPGMAGATPCLRREGPGSHPPGGRPDAHPGAGRDGDLVPGHPAAGVAVSPRRPTGRLHLHHLARAHGGRSHLPADPHLVPDRVRRPPPEGRAGDCHRPGCGCEKKLIETAYRSAPGLGLEVWCCDQAGPFQTAPHPGRS
jgi:hypothetical protein